MTSDEFHFHRMIEFDVLRQTKKAVLIRVEHLGSEMANNLLCHYGPKVMEPLELWIPKSWFKFDHEGNPWIWEKGLMINLMKLAEKRLKHIDNTLPEGERLH